MTTFLAFATDPKAPLPGQLAWMAAVYTGRLAEAPAAERQTIAFGTLWEVRNVEVLIDHVNARREGGR